MPAKIGTGDDGTTALLSGKRVPKDDPRIELVGIIDELESAFGMIVSEELDDYTRQVTENIPHLLIEIAGEIVGDGKFTVENLTTREIEKMERWIVFLDKKMPEINKFVLFNGLASARWLNFARATVRQAERKIYPLFKKELVRSEIFVFFNRLSRLLFSLERWEKLQHDETEEKLERGRVLPEPPENG